MVIAAQPAEHSGLDRSGRHSEWRHGEVRKEYNKHEILQTYFTWGASLLNAGRAGSWPHASWAHSSLQKTLCLFSSFATTNNDTQVEFHRDEICCIPLKYEYALLRGIEILIRVAAYHRNPNMRYGVMVRTCEIRKCFAA